MSSYQQPGCERGSYQGVDRDAHNHGHEKLEDVRQGERVQPPPEMLLRHITQSEKAQGRIFIELMTSDHKLKAFSEGSK